MLKEIQELAHHLCITYPKSAYNEHDVLNGNGTINNGSDWQSVNNEASEDGEICVTTCEQKNSISPSWFLIKLTTESMSWIGNSMIQSVRI